MLLTLFVALLQPLLAQPDRFGLPACSAPDQELAYRSAFVLCYNSTLKVPIWTAHELTPETPAGAAPRPKHFRHDYLLNGSSAFDSDYRNSGFSRGHMVPAADLGGNEEALRDSFLL